MKFLVELQVADYPPRTKWVEADNQDYAIDYVRKYVRNLMTLPMYYESYKVISYQNN